MKRVITLVLVMALVTASVFAASIVSSSSSASRMYDYLGLNIGFGITNESYDFMPGVPREDKGYQLGLSVNDFTFFDKDDSVGMYIEVGANINTKTDTTIGGVKTDEERIVPFFADIAIGVAFKMSIDRKTALLIGVGPDFMMYSKENHNYWTDAEWECLIIGAGFDVEGVYKVGQDVYIGVGFRGSINFYGVIMETTKTWTGHEKTTYIDLDNYFGYRVLPRFSVYFGV